MEPTQPCSRTPAHEVIDAMIERMVLASRRFYNCPSIDCSFALREYIYGLFDCGLPFDEHQPPLLNLGCDGRSVQIEWVNRHIHICHQSHHPLHWTVYMSPLGKKHTCTPIYLPKQMNEFRAAFYAN